MYQSAEEMVKENQQATKQIFRLAEVTSLDSKGRAKVKFFGEDTESGKTYSYIDGYVPEVGDKVLMLGQANTFIIMGEVTVEEVIVKYALADHVHKQYALTTEVATKDHKHDDDYAAKEHTHSNYADKDHEHSDYASAEHTHSSIKGTSRSIAFSGNEIIPDVTGVVDIGSSSRGFRNVYAEQFITDGYTLSPSIIFSNSSKSQYVEVKDNVFTPSRDELFDLGSQSYQFSKIYVTQAYLDGRRWYPYRIISDSYPDSRYIDFNGDTLLPNASGLYNIGTSSRQYKAVYAQNVYVNGTAVSTSDKRKKKFIKKLPDKYVELFKKLRPVTFKYKNGTSGRIHAGFIAQEVELAMQECGITSEEFGGLVIQKNGEYGLRYEEFIALQTAVIQDLQKRVEELERRVKGW